VPQNDRQVSRVILVKSQAFDRQLPKRQGGESRTYACRLLEAVKTTLPQIPPRRDALRSCANPGVWYLTNRLRASQACLQLDASIN
jgi:hypothetical protein